MSNLPALRRLLAICLLPVALAACAPSSAGPELGAPEAHRRAQAGELILIDIRRPEEWRQTGVAQGAARIDMRRPDFADAVLRQVDGKFDAPIGIICRTGNRTTQMQKAMLDAGFTQVYNIREGMAGSAAGPGWLRQGLPVERCANC
ncbi:MAG: rhodanese-like domain-containing protein [Hydrogenophilales bacterium]|nr:rhodanese-like domain-containing protein [Hydrogenophilales bacterium]